MDETMNSIVKYLFDFNCEVLLKRGGEEIDEKMKEVLENQPNGFIEYCLEESESPKFIEDVHENAKKMRYFDYKKAKDYVKACLSKELEEIEGIDLVCMASELYLVDLNHQEEEEISKETLMEHVMNYQESPESQDNEQFEYANPQDLANRDVKYLKNVWKSKRECFDLDSNYPDGELEKEENKPPKDTEEESKPHEDRPKEENKPEMDTRIDVSDGKHSEPIIETVNSDPVPKEKCFTFGTSVLLMKSFSEARQKKNWKWQDFRKYTRGSLEGLSPSCRCLFKIGDRSQPCYIVSKVTAMDGKVKYLVFGQAAIASRNGCFTNAHVIKKFPHAKKVEYYLFLTSSDEEINIRPEDFPQFKIEEFHFIDKINRTVDYEHWFDHSYPNDVTFGEFDEESKKKFNLFDRIIIPFVPEDDSDLHGHIFPGKTMFSTQTEKDGKKVLPTEFSSFFNMCRACPCLFYILYRESAGRFGRKNEWKDMHYILKSILDDQCFPRTRTKRFCDYFTHVLKLPLETIKTKPIIVAHQLLMFALLCYPRAVQSMFRKELVNHSHFSPFHDFIPKNRWREPGKRVTTKKDARVKVKKGYADKLEIIKKKKEGKFFKELADHVNKNIKKQRRKEQKLEEEEEEEDGEGEEKEGKKKVKKMRKKMRKSPWDYKVEVRKKLKGMYKGELNTYSTISSGCSGCNLSPALKECKGRGVCRFLSLGLIAASKEDEGPTTRYCPWSNPDNQRLYAEFVLKRGGIVDDLKKRGDGRRLEYLMKFISVIGRNEVQEFSSMKKFCGVGKKN